MTNSSSSSVASALHPTGAIHSYLLGESVKNVVLRLTLILTAIISIWSCMIAVSMIRTRYRRRKQTFKSSHSLHHLTFENAKSVGMTHPSQRRSRFDSSSTPLSRKKTNVFERILPSIKRPVRKETVAYRSVLKKEQHPPSDPAKIHAVIEAMTRRSFTSSHRGSLEKNPLPYGEEISRDHQLKTPATSSPTYSHTVSFLFFSGERREQPLLTDVLVESSSFLSLRFDDLRR